MRRDAWIKLTDYRKRHAVWVNMRRHDYMVAAENQDGTIIQRHKGGHMDVQETPEQILALLEHTHET